MPTTIRTGVMKIKDQNGNYIPVDGLMSETAQEELADIQSAGQAQVAAVQTAGQSQVATIQSAGQTQTTAIQNKGTEILNSLPSDYTEVESNVSEIRSALSGMNTATSTAIGKALSPKTVADGKVTEWQFKTIPSGGGSGGGAVDDVQIDGVSVVQDGVANVPIGANTKGVVNVSTNTAYGLQINSSTGFLQLAPASESDIKSASYAAKPIGTTRQHESTFYGLAKAAGDTTQSASSNAVGNYTDSAKSAIHEMLNGPVTVSGTTPSITALPGIQYVCGEVSTLDITLPASGCIDVVFQSGSTATVLTVTPPTGVTVKWANGFDPTALEANTTYEINIKDGLGVAGSWT